MRVVCSIGGSVLAPSLEADRVAGYAAAVEELAGEGCELGVVVGGGDVAREYISTARELGANEAALDRLGVAATRLNARLLGSALEETPPSPVESYEAAVEAIRRGDVATMGGVVVGQTTDAVAAALAESIDADLLVYATNTDGVYDADPAIDPDAERFDRLTPSELVDVVAPMSRDAGASAPVDLLAATLIQRSALRAVVLDGTDPGRIVDAVLRGEHDGTDIVPAATAEPGRWAGQP